MARSIPLLPLLVAAPGLCQGASLIVDVVGTGGSGVDDAVVYAIPEQDGPARGAPEAVMDQQDRTFLPHVLPVQTGTAVSFPNSDDVRHQVYSFSPAKRFQLSLYEGTPPTPILFDRPGVVALGCNIHDRMSAYIVVVDTPHFVVTRKGRGELAELPSGSYSLRVWYPGMRAEPAPVSLTLAAAERRVLEISIQRR